MGPSREEWLQAARRVGLLAGSGGGLLGASYVVRLLAHGLDRSHGLGVNDVYVAQYVASVPVAVAGFLAIVTGVAWTVGALLVQSIPAARRPFRSVGRGLAATARKHPTFTTKVAPWVPGLVAAYAGTGPGNLSDISLVPHLVGLSIVLLGSYALCRRPLTRLAASRTEPEPLAEAVELPRYAEAAPQGGSNFRAVAVTRTTKGIVGAAVSATLAALIGAFVLPTAAFSGLGGVSLALYAALMLAVSVGMRRSRMVVGNDGLLVLGADRPRFLPYADHDAVREEWGDVVLVSRGKVTARLQLDDADRGRAPELVERLKTAMSLAAKMRNEGADYAARVLVDREGGSEALAAAARGTDYRTPAIVRENLWALVEGPLADANTRLLVAEALSHDLRDEERPRLRVAAKECAEPRVRIALEKLAGDDDEAQADPPEEKAAARLAMQR